MLTNSSSDGHPAGDEPAAGRRGEPASVDQAGAQKIVGEEPVEREEWRPSGEVAFLHIRTGKVRLALRVEVDSADVDLQKTFNFFICSLRRV